MWLYALDLPLLNCQYCFNCYWLNLIETVLTSQLRILPKKKYRSKKEKSFKLTILTSLLLYFPLFVYFLTSFHRVVVACDGNISQLLHKYLTVATSLLYCEKMQGWMKLSFLLFSFLLSVASDLHVMKSVQGMLQNKSSEHLEFKAQWFCIPGPGRLVTLLWQKCSQICCWQEKSKEGAPLWSFRSYFEAFLGLQMFHLGTQQQLGMAQMYNVYLQMNGHSHTSCAPKSQDGVWLTR